eukprot:scaffold311402_cov36-Prasinocladus_malaysianus.AAC.1
MSWRPGSSQLATYRIVGWTVGSTCSTTFTFSDTPLDRWMVHLDVDLTIRTGLRRCLAAES